MKKPQLCHYKDNYKCLILRDYLALDRTILANKRTLLAYARTFVGLVAGGIGMIKLVVDTVINIVGYLFIIAAFPILVIGIREYIITKRNLNELSFDKEEEQP